MNLIGDTFRLYFKNLRDILRPSVFFMLPVLVTLAAMIPGFMTHFSLLLESIALYTGGTEVPPILSQRVSDFQMFLLPLMLISQMAFFFWQGAVTHLAGVRLGIIPSEDDPGPAMAVIKKFFPLFLTGLLVGSLMMLTSFISMFTLFVPTIVLSVLVAFVPVAVMAANSYGGSALVKSFKLIRGRFFRTAGIMLLALIIGTLTTLFLSLGAVIIISFFVSPGLAEQMPDPGTIQSGNFIFPEGMITAMSIGYLICLALMFLIKGLIEIPLAFIGITRLYAEANTEMNISPSPET